MGAHHTATGNGSVAGDRGRRPSPGRSDHDVVRAVALAANTAASLHEALTAAATAVCDATGWPACVVWEATSEGTALAPTVVTADGETAIALRRLEVLEPVDADGLGVVATMFRADAAAVMYRLDDDDGPAGAIAREAGLHMGAAFAVTAHGHVAAVLEFLAPDGAEPSPPLVAALDTVVRQLSFVAQRHVGHVDDTAAGPGLAEAFTHATDGFVGLDAEGHVQAWNRQAQLLFGWTPDHVIGRADALAWLTPTSLVGAGGDCPLARLARDTDDESRTVRLTLRHRHGTEVPVWATAWTPRRGELATAMLLRPVADGEVAWQHPDDGATTAGTDPITGAATQPAFLRRLSRLLADHTGTVVVAMVDIDRLADVNRRLGLATGDATLAAAARRLEAFASAAGRVGRCGGDELAVALTHVGADETDLRHLGWRLIELFEAPLEGVDPALTVGVSVGLATTDDLADPSAGALLSGAHVALRRAKQRGARRVGRYDLATDRDALDQDRLNADLRPAIETGELELHYQPQVDVRTGRITAVEALVRWRHADFGLVGPDRFIPEAERAGLIRQLGRQVLDLALADLQTWRRQGHTISALAVNLSAAQLDQPDFHQVVLDLVAQHDLATTDLVLEITETALSQDVDHAMGQLTTLRTAGVRIAIDDFGCGYSTLRRVHDHPFDEVKLDRAFITDVSSIDQPVPVLEAAVAMAHGMGMQVVIEGVETQPQLAAAIRAGCDKAQGFLIARPVPPARISQMLEHPDG